MDVIGDALKNLGQVVDVHRACCGHCCIVDGDVLRCTICGKEGSERDFD